MLTGIHLTDFKSYRAATLPLAPLTVLLGANASGKSNAIEGLRLLSWLAQGHKLSTIEYAVQDSDRVVRGRVADLGYRGQATFGLGCNVDGPEKLELRMELTAREDGLHITAEEATSPFAKIPLYTMVEAAGRRGSDVKVACDNFARGGVKPRVTCSDQSAIFTQLDTPAAFHPANATARRRIPKVTRTLQSLLSGVIFLDPVPAQMRDYSFPSEHQMRGNGRNLSAVLKRLWDEQQPEDGAESRQAENRRLILEFIRSLPEQDITGVDFLTEPRGGVLVTLTETFGGEERTFDASLLSDGTLRVLAIAAALLSADPGSLVVIEEIDNGVHPSRAHQLLGSIQQVAVARKLRVLLTTHNPALLDAIPDAALPNAVFCWRDPTDGASRLASLSSLPDYPELIAQGPLGYLVTRGILDRFAKQVPDRGARRRAALDWLARMRALPDAPA